MDRFPAQASTQAGLQAASATHLDHYTRTRVIAYRGSLGRRSKEDQANDVCGAPLCSPVRGSGWRWQFSRGKESDTASVSIS